MSADGEVEVSVRAEGVDQAVGEMGGDALAETGGGAAAAAGPPGGGGGRGGGKVLGKLLTRILGLLAFLGPILDVIKVFTDIATAFVAPLAVLLLRLFQPVLRIMLKVLPVWFDIMDFVNTLVKNTSPLLRMLGVFGILISLFMNADGKLGTIRDKITGALKDAITSLPRRIWSFMQRLDTMIGNAIIDALPSSIVPSGPGDVSEREREVVERAEQVSDVAAAGGLGGPVSIAIEGGLDAFVNRIERDPNTELQ